MALIAVRFLLDKLGSLLSSEVQLLAGVRREVEEIKNELESMRSFLQDADARSEDDQGVKTWVRQVRDVAYDTEDVLDEFLLRLETPHGHGFIHSFHVCLRYLKQLNARRRLGNQVRDIKTRIQLISERRTKYAFKKIEDGMTTNAASDRWHDPRLASLYIDEADVVGIEKPRNLLLKWLTEGESRLTVISVVGMGGQGKTTLVKKVYDSQIIKIRFDCCAWITVSTSFTAGELLRAALKGFLEATKEPAPEGIATMSDFKLIEMLRNHLQQKRYVITLDDVWNINAWEAIRYAFPDCNNGSRIMFTTRISDVAASVEIVGHVYHLPPLSEEEAWTLFCMKAFRSTHENSCPQELKELSLNILKKCGGLPLAIVVIGGLLSKKNKLLIEWKKIHDSLSAEMRNDYSLENLGKILLLSYNDLPYYLKSCYLYMSIFPEDYLMKRAKLIRLWVMEGFVEEKHGLMSEEVAEDYLNELISRSMIQVVEMGYFNRVKTCRLHDLMREIILSKSREEHFCTVTGGGGMKLDGKVRRMSIHNTTESLPSDTQFPCLRSLSVFQFDESPHYFSDTFFHGFRLLRVLELERAPLVKFPPELVKLFHLRYLSLRWTRIRELPESLGKLKNLEILDLKGTYVSVLPIGILKMKNLRHLRSYCYRFDSSIYFSSTYGISLPMGIGSLTSLQKLSSIEVNQGGNTMKELEKLSQLRDLGILNLKGEDGIDLCSTFEKLKHLTGIYAVSKDTNECLNLESLSSPPQHLQRLYLKFCLATLPDWIASLRWLVKLVLQDSNLSHDPLIALQGMGSLVWLELREAYNGEELSCDVGGYPRLKTLGLCQSKRLKRVRIEKGAMPMLKRLDITLCTELETVPLGIEHLTNLEELQLLDMDRKFLNKLKRFQGEDYLKVRHIPMIRHIYELGGKWVVGDIS